MINIKKYFVIASLSIGALSPAMASADSAADAGTQPVAIATADPASSHEAVTPAAKASSAKPAEQALTEPSNWSMLLVGAGVLLLPRKRRVDNLVR